MGHPLIVGQLSPRTLTKEVSYEFLVCRVRQAAFLRADHHRGRTHLPQVLLGTAREAEKRKNIWPQQAGRSSRSSTVAGRSAGVEMTFFNRLLRLRKKVIFRKPKGCIGLCEINGHIWIALRARRISPAQIYLHELIHAYRPNWSETQVLAMERYIWKRLSNRELYDLYRKLFLHPYKDREEV